MEIVRLSSWEKIISSDIAELLDASSGDPPVVAVLGPAGSGKSVFLNELLQRCREGRPVARVDLRANRRLRPHEVALRLALGLSRRIPSYGELQFPRLVLGAVTVQLADTGAGRSMTADQLRQQIDSDTGLLDRISGIIRGLPADVGANVGERLLFGLAAEGAFAALRSARRVRNPGYPWYQAELQEDEPWKALLTLHDLEIAYKGSEGTWPDRVDEILCGAFLADLRAEFSGRLRASTRTGRCLALLDDVDCSAGRDFLAFLLARRAKDAGLRRDPLLVVTTSKQRLVGRVPEQRYDDLAYEVWNTRRAPAIHRIPLCSMTPSEADRFAEATGYYPLDARGSDVAEAITFAHRLSGGHVWSFELLTCAIAARWKQLGQVSRAEFPAVFDWLLSDQPTNTVGEAVLRYLLGPDDPDLADALVTCSAAPDFERGSHWRAMFDADGDVLRRLRTMREESTLVRPVDIGADGRMVLQPLLHRVLLWRLSQRPGEHPDRWRRVHERLLDKAPDELHRTYHHMALGNVDTVVKSLDATFRNTDKATWWRDVRFVTGAPMNDTYRQPGPEGRLPPAATIRDQIAERVPDGEFLPAKLVASLWVAADPLGDPLGTLDPGITEQLRNLASKAPDGDILFDAADVDALRREKRRSRWAEWDKRWEARVGRLTAQGAV